ncbi:hypothetical protein [Campylobacter corcagiensis]|uniref:Uncharacterized protein n=1 Tax=Campylobacter corcagiensis TaxID=1448857 RepID=A0A7M1LFQ7_9BACT|nr:hypothetical protein [Campylobacter corcagiensis]QKF64694.1 hypothetical protein CCORG_0837 [Campylobacter corcagiensis]QOQ87141.1 hypothetical protein IMC76_07990 [Campylobacter corcagiensis]
MNIFDEGKLKQELAKLSECEIIDEMYHTNKTLADFDDIDCFISFDFDDIAYLKFKLSILEDICLYRGYYDKWYSK